MTIPRIIWPKSPTIWTQDDTTYISIPFTWNLPAIKQELIQKDFLRKKRIVIGGPALKLIPNFFDDMPEIIVKQHYAGALQKVNKLATRTTLGCPNSCGFCAVPQIEGQFHELNDWPNFPILCDNNLLAASKNHFDKVCDALLKHDFCDFNQGLDARRLTDYHAARLADLPRATVRLALDSMSQKDIWDCAIDKLLSAGFPKYRIRSYVLIAFRSDPEDSWARCKHVNNRGIMPCPQWYHPLDAMVCNQVLMCHSEYGWNEEKRKHIMGYYYQHRGQPL